MTTPTNRKKLEDPANLKELLLAKLSGGLGGLAPFYGGGDTERFVATATQVLEQKFPTFQDESDYLFGLIEAELIYPIFYPPQLPEDANYEDIRAARETRNDRIKMLIHVRESRLELNWSIKETAFFEDSESDDANG